jgi:hypothetical protein
LDGLPNFEQNLAERKTHLDTLCCYTMNSKDLEMTSAFQWRQRESSQKCIIAESQIMFKAQPKVQ